MDAASLSDEAICAAFPEYAFTFPRIGMGGFKVAYRATTGATEVALKILRPPVSPESTEFDPELPGERFSRELLAMRSSKSPHIVQTIQAPETRQIGELHYVWYAERFLSGGTLKELLQREKTLVPSVVASIGRQLLTAVAHMWNEYRYCHRDIKPGNIAFDSQGLVVLVDLGTVLFRDLDDMTQSGALAPATPSYAAPEQYILRKHTEVDFRTDLYQVGVVLLECIMGSNPLRFGGAAAANNLDSLSEATLAEYGLPAGLRRTIPRLVAYHQSRRFRTPEAALDSLGEA